MQTDARPRRQPFLDDHRIDGTPVLPGVMGMEAFAEAARALLPGWQVVALEDVDSWRRSSSTATSRARSSSRALVRDGGDGTLVADCRLIGRRDAARPGRAGDACTSPAACGWRASAAGAARRRPTAGGRWRAGVGHDAVYRVYFHGPAYQVLDRAWREQRRT